MNNKRAISIYNAITGLLLTVVNGVFGIIVVRLVISKFGSDFNGVNSTANQIINVLLVFEGGFTLASNVALFKPVIDEDYSLVNTILFHTQKKFRKIGILFLFFGVLTSVVYALMANSNLDRKLIFLIIIMAIIPSAFNLFYASTYRVFIQANQKEYIINIITTITLGLGYVANIIMISNSGKIWMFRFITMVFGIINSILLGLYVKVNYKEVDISEGCNDFEIKGTKDVFVQKITGIIYTSAPMLFLSISPSGGTVVASVYAVYNSIFSLAKSLVKSIIDAPRLGIGQMLSNGRKEDVYKVFEVYEFLVVVLLFVLGTTAYVLILPFIDIYTNGISDAQYHDGNIALFMILITIFELVHIPSGHILNMAGEFRVSMIIQNIALSVLVCMMAILGIRYGVYGMLISVLVVAIILAIMEIGYVHVKFFLNKTLNFVKVVIPFLLMGVLVAEVEERLLLLELSNIKEFIVNSVFVLAINSFVAIMICVLFDRRYLDYFIKKFMKIFK